VAFVSQFKTGIDTIQPQHRKSEDVSAG